MTQCETTKDSHRCKLPQGHLARHRDNNHYTWVADDREITRQTDGAATVKVLEVKETPQPSAIYHRPTDVPINKPAAVVVFFPHYGFNDGIEPAKIIELPWRARVTWKCSVCGGRTSKYLNGVGEFPFLLKLTCSSGHENICEPIQSIQHGRSAVVTYSSSEIEEQRQSRMQNNKQKSHLRQIRRGRSQRI
jgi:hypothetical protein